MKGKGKDDWEAEELIALARKLQPGIIIDNRTEIEQDLWTPEQYPAAPSGCAIPKPASWSPGKPARPSPAAGAIIATSRPGRARKCSSACWSIPFRLGGNLLMNVGPTSRGYFDSRALGRAEGIRRLDEIQLPLDLRLHAWPSRNSSRPPIAAIRRARTASACICICLHIRSRIWQLKGLAGKVDYAQFLHDGSEVLFNDGEVKHFSEGRLERRKPAGALPAAR